MDLVALLREKFYCSSGNLPGFLFKMQGDAASRKSHDILGNDNPMVIIQVSIIILTSNFA